MHRNSVDHKRLMRESGDRVHSALYSADPNEQLVASRLLESPSAFSAWEGEHSGLMLEVANPSFRRTQAALLKKATFRLIHRKALFEYLRDARIRGSMRQRIIVSFHPTQDYTRSIIAEHGLYLRKACSFLCTSHVGGNVVRDPGFFDPMRCYHELYAEYFQIFCSTHFGTDSADTEPQAELLPLLKQQLERCRIAIMNPQPETEWPKREAELRRPIGDTARLPGLDGFQRKS
ncbi:MAG: hypothetical protein QOK23_4292 [Gammaproteobacteria bacterium]|nr:hypothetical protein [Gammaproteobacteria bacterium]